MSEPTTASTLFTQIGQTNLYIALEMLTASEMIAPLLHEWWKARPAPEGWDPFDDEMVLGHGLYRTTTAHPNLPAEGECLIVSLGPYLERHTYLLVEVDSGRLWMASRTSVGWGTGTPTAFTPGWRSLSGLSRKWPANANWLDTSGLNATPSFDLYPFGISHHHESGGDHGTGKPTTQHVAVECWRRAPDRVMLVMRENGANTGTPRQWLARFDDGGWTGWVPWVWTAQEVIEAVQQHQGVVVTGAQIGNIGPALLSSLATMPPEEIAEIVDALEDEIASREELAVIASPGQVVSGYGVEVDGADTTRALVTSWAAGRVARYAEAAIEDGVVRLSGESEAYWLDLDEDAAVTAATFEDVNPTRHGVRLYVSVTGTAELSFGPLVLWDVPTEVGGAGTLHEVILFWGPVGGQLVPMVRYGGEAVVP